MKKLALTSLVSLALLGNSCIFNFDNEDREKYDQNPVHISGVVKNELFSPYNPNSYPSHTFSVIEHGTNKIYMFESENSTMRKQATMLDLAVNPGDKVNIVLSYRQYQSAQNNSIIRDMWPSQVSVTSKKN